MTDFLAARNYGNGQFVAFSELFNGIDNTGDFLIAFACAFPYVFSIYDTSTLLLYKAELLVCYSWKWGSIRKNCKERIKR